MPPDLPLPIPRAITLDLDDTLWPVRPVIRRAEAVLRDWLLRHAPATAARWDAAGLAALRAEVERAHPQWAHDLGALRRATLQRAVAAVGEPAALADAAYEVFLAERQRVEFYPDALDALRRLAARFPLLSLSNGNADLRRVGVADWFVGALSAGEAGHAKPDPRIYAEACRRLGRLPAEVLHVGDDLEMDVRGAQDAGLAAVWLCRPEHGHATAPAGAHARVVSDLGELARRLGC